MKLILLLCLFIWQVHAKLKYRGASIEYDLNSYKTLKDANANVARTYAAYRYLYQDFKGTFDASLRVENLRTAYASNIKLLDDWSASTLNFGYVDKQIEGLKQVGINSIIEIGEGTQWCLPYLDHKQSEEVIDPNNVGKEAYLAYIYRYSRAVVRRYKKDVKMYQIENEMNEAYLYSIIGWKKFRVFDNAWHDWSFVTSIMKYLYLAVKDECSDCLTTQNVHSDLPKELHHLYLSHGYYLDAIADWIEYMDVVSFDAYPNYYVATPLRYDVIGERTKAIYDVLKSLPAPHNKKEVFVMETGYPASNLTSPLPASLNFTEDSQYTWVNEAIKSHVEAGGVGMVYFKVQKQPGVTPPPGGYTKEDAEAMAVLADLYQQENLLQSIEWMATHIGYLSSRFGTIAGSIEKGWGLLHLDGTPRKGLIALKESFNKYA
mmetsp:Transcript_14288/g.21598  ORF Transcript_14288/g.21598 Transcript_14288/m.21598 type:complete len:432 (+) Transcript_14288:38-1333(+)